LNIYILSCCVVEKCARRGAQSWWGGRLACLADSLATYVILISRYVSSLSEPSDEVWSTDMTIISRKQQS
jgi:hypothetical protein